MTTATSNGSTRHRWRFFRAGGLDLVRIETADDLRHLPELDQKLWTALACPVKGLELDEKTLALIDSDKDGRVRAPEIIDAVRWICDTLHDPASIVSGSDSIPLSAIKDSAILASAQEVLSGLSKRDATTISLADVSDTARIYAGTRFNGDGVITPSSTDDPGIQKVIGEIITCVGSVPDRSGQAGIDVAKLTAFWDALAAFAQWHQRSVDDAKSILPLGETTVSAFAALTAVRNKIDDFFARTRLAAFDTRALAAVNRHENDYLVLAAKDMTVSTEEIASFPLARVEPGRALPLAAGVNPAWADRLAQFRQLVVSPLLGNNAVELSETQWSEIKARFTALEGWLGAKAGTAVESLGIARVRELLAGKAREQLNALIEEDRKLEPHFNAIASVERLLRYHRDLYRLLLNFVSFADFYDPRRPAIFQNGTLYLDSRSCDLCVRVDAANPLAAMSKVYIAYCNCTRPGSPPMTIAACFTQGDSDYLFVGRHGLFYDRQGRDWDAVITSVVENPISIRQAFWAPYKKFIRLIEEQIAKRAAAAEAASTTKLSTAAEKTANLDQAKPAEPAKKVDVGTVAALGVALGALTTALGYFLGFFRAMPAWQVPLVFIAVILLISLPSMIIAALKLRQRTLGPILDGNGWAVNGRVKITMPLGTELTERAVLPPGSQRMLEDPYAEKKAPWKLYAFILLLLAGAAVWVRWDHNRRGRYFWQPAPAATTTVEPEASGPPPAPEPSTSPPQPAQ